MLIAAIYFDCSNPFYFYHSDLILSFRDALLDPLRSNLLTLLLSDMLALLLSASFFSILLYYDSIVSDNFPQLYMLCFVCFVSFMIISDCSARDPLLLLYYVILAFIRSAWLVSICLSSLISALSFAPLELS